MSYQLAPTGARTKWCVNPWPWPFQSKNWPIFNRLVSLGGQKWPILNQLKHFTACKSNESLREIVFPEGKLRLENLWQVKKWGSTEIRTRIVGFKVQSDSHYTIRPDNKTQNLKLEMKSWETRGNLSKVDLETQRSNRSNLETRLWTWK